MAASISANTNTISGVQVLPDSSQTVSDSGSMPKQPTANTEASSGKMSRICKRLGADASIGKEKLPIPDKTTREPRKVAKKVGYAENVRSMYRYDDKGVLIRAQRDLCDCLSEQCPGCHYPCPSCKSPKCGPECRCNRRWVYEQLEVEGTDIVMVTPLKTRSAIGGYQYYH